MALSSLLWLSLSFWLRGCFFQRVGAGSGTNELVKKKKYKYPLVISHQSEHP
jgi:hypothetical protein